MINEEGRANQLDDDISEFEPFISDFLSDVNYQSAFDHILLNPAESFCSDEIDLQQSLDLDVFCHEPSSAQGQFMKRNEVPNRQEFSSQDAEVFCPRPAGIALFSPAQIGVPGVSQGFPRSHQNPIGSPLRVIRVFKNTEKCRPPKMKKNLNKEKAKKKKTKRLPNSMQVGLLSGLAFLNSPKGWCSLREIYTFICEYFDGYSLADEEWKNPIRHSLCTQVMYGKINGSGNWQLADKQAFLVKLDAYTAKRDVLTYGLREPSLWEEIRTGKRGLPFVVNEPGKNAVKRRTSSLLEGSKKGRHSIEKEFQPCLSTELSAIDERNW